MITQQDITFVLIEKEWWPSIEQLAQRRENFKTGRTTNHQQGVYQLKSTSKVGAVGEVIFHNWLIKNGRQATLITDGLSSDGGKDEKTSGGYTNVRASKTEVSLTKNLIVQADQLTTADYYVQVFVSFDWDKKEGCGWICGAEEKEKIICDEYYHDELTRLMLPYPSYQKEVGTLNITPKELLEAPYSLSNYD